MAVKIRRLRTDKKQFFTVRVYRVSLVGLQNGRFVVGTIPGAEPRILRVLWFNWVKKVSTAFACKYTAKRFVFLCIQVCANSQTKGLERVLKRRARLGRTLNIQALGVWACEASRAEVSHATPVLTDFEKKADCFAVYPANERLDWPSLGWPRKDGAPVSWQEVKQCHQLAHASWNDTIR